MLIIFLCCSQVYKNIFIISKPTLQEQSMKYCKAFIYLLFSETLGRCMALSTEIRTENEEATSSSSSRTLGCFLTNLLRLAVSWWKLSLGS